MVNAACSFFWHHLVVQSLLEISVNWITSASELNFGHFAIPERNRWGVVQRQFCQYYCYTFGWTLVCGTALLDFENRLIQSLALEYLLIS